jgi:hypothetical protein
VKDIASPVRTTCDGIGVYFRGDIPEDPTNPLDPVQPVDRSTSLSPETPMEELMDSTENG